MLGDARREMDDGVGLIIEAETLLTYYDDTDPSNNGQLELVTDHNGVETAYDYDEWGYVKSIKEGVATGPDNRVNLARTSDAAGRQTAGSDDAGKRARRPTTTPTTRPTTTATPLLWDLAKHRASAETGRPGSRRWKPAPAETRSTASASRPGFSRIA